MTGPNRNLIWARTFLDELARAGVREVSIAPGSRSAPLVLAAAADPRLRVFTHLDERSAAFFALGIGKRTRRPAAVVTTSGTAAANLLPAVVESATSETPLLLLTADRPHRLRGADANQAIDQNRLFGSYVREYVETAPPEVTRDALVHLRGLGARVVASSLGLPAGPVHVNVPLAKPLEPTEVPTDMPDGFESRHPLAARGREGGRPVTRIGERRSAPPAEAVERLAHLAARTPRGLVVAGPSPEPGRDGPAALALASQLHYPLLADPLSGARFGPSGGASRIGGYDLFLTEGDDEAALLPDLVVRFGTSPTSAALNRFLERASAAEQWVVDPGGRWKDHRVTATEYVLADPMSFAHAVCAAHALPASAAEQDEWLDRWELWGAAAERTAGEAFHRALFEGAVVGEVVRTAPEGSTIFVSSSMPVRDLDAFGFPRDAPLTVYGNRGASGIDGIVSSAAGVAAGGEEPVIAIVGDVAFAHDMNGLLAARDHADVVIVLINNDGGGIFHLLPIREFEPEFTKHFATPHGLQFAHAAATYGIPHEKVAGVTELTSAVGLALKAGGSHIIEIETRREENRERRQSVVDAVRASLSEKPSNAGDHA